MNTQEIGKVLMNARIEQGYSRNALVQKKNLKGKITGEGLRKIEYGERIPRFETLRRLATALGIKEEGIIELEQKALTKTVERITRKSNREKVSFHIEGQPVRMVLSPTSSKIEAKVRDSVEQIIKLVDLYGVMMKEDKEHLRRHARSILNKQFSA